MGRLQLRFRNNTNALIYALTVQDLEFSAQTEEDGYMAHHVCIRENSNNRFKEPDLVGISDYDRQIITLLKTGDAPLFQYDTKKKLLTCRSKENALSRHVEYIVISHVWVDGFGNPTENKVCRCLLDLIAGLFPEDEAQLGGTLKRGQESKTGKSRLFWIGTLGIPIIKDLSEEEKEIRNRAIEAMHIIYKSASHTLVLDRALLRRQKARGYFDAAMRITLSRWSRRLWTLQEAILSKSLYFCFQDHAYSIDALEELFREEDIKLHVSVARLAQQYRKCILRGEQSNNGKDFHEATPLTTKMVGQVWKAVQWRTTAHLRHKTLALALLFGLPTEDFADANNENII